MPAECDLASMPGIASRRAHRTMQEPHAGPLFIADWNRTLFIHYEVEAAALQPFVPFALDLREGRAYVSFVAFRLDRMRPALFPGRVGEWLLRSLSGCRFLNLRTYVVSHGEPGIFFLTEWVSSLFSVPLGPPVFGLPYRAGRLEFQHRPEAGRISGRVSARRGGGALSYSAEMDPNDDFAPSEPGSLTEFLLERYVAFTERKGRRRFFNVWHEPWPQKEAVIDVQDEDLLATCGAWSSKARRIGAHFSPGVRGVWMGRPRKLEEEEGEGRETTYKDYENQRN